MSNEFKDVPGFQPWGPFISPTYENEPITQSDIIVASIVWGLTLVNVIVALWLIYKQTKNSRVSLRSVYIWMIWLELIVCFLMGLQSYLHLLKLIRPSFAFYFTMLFWWCIQVQLLLQIIINRIRVIVPDRHRSRWIMIGTATFVTAINISVFNIWIPARLQISHAYHTINEIWDRIEKVLYLIVDAGLNWYFLKTVKDNLISNGLTKYNKLVRFNQKIVVVSLIMDATIIGAMSIPNSFVYIQFHPLAYMVKLNIEMTMANLIKRIAISTSRKTGMASIAQEFNCSSNLSTTGRGTNGQRKPQCGSVHELSSFVSYSADTKANDRDRVVGFASMENHIKETHEVIIRSKVNPFYDHRDSESEITGGQYHARRESQGGGGVLVEEKRLSRQKSMESITEGNESMKSMEMINRTEDSDDEAALVDNKSWWPRRPN